MTFNDYVVIESKDSKFNFKVCPDKIDYSFLLNSSRGTMKAHQRNIPFGYLNEKITLPFSEGVVRHIQQYLNSQFEDAWRGTKHRIWFNVSLENKTTNVEPESSYLYTDSETIEMEDWDGVKRWFSVPIEHTYVKKVTDNIPIGKFISENLCPIDIEDLEILNFFTFVSEYLSAKSLMEMNSKDSIKLVPGHNKKIYPTLFFFLCLSEFLSVPFSFQINGDGIVRDKDFLINSIGVHKDFQAFKDIMIHTITKRK